MKMRGTGCAGGKGGEGRERTLNLSTNSFPENGTESIGTARQCP